MNEEKWEIGGFLFENQSTYEKAKKEQDILNVLDKKVDMTDTKALLKIYNKFVNDRTFSTVIGFTFLEQIRHQLVENEPVMAGSLPSIPIRESKKRKTELKEMVPIVKEDDAKYQLLYEDGKGKILRLRIILVAMLVFVLGIAIINLKSQYSVFTYFTDYKTKMEEELVNKYEKWESDLTEREKTVKQQEQKNQVSQ